jgi:tetraacyldisaccharide 4'-kinase
MERKMTKVLLYLLLPVRVILVPVYYCIFQIIKFFNEKKQKKFGNVKIVCVGNHTLGGSGKTTIVWFFTEELVKKGKKLGIVMRGYKRKNKEKKVVVLKPNEKVSTEVVEQVGDEAYMLYSKLNIPVAVSSERVDAISELLKQSDIEIIISDDGYQNFKFYKDINILVINIYDFMTKPQIIFPLGNLREPLSSAVKRAQYVILNHSKIVRISILADIKNKIKFYNKDVGIISTSYKITDFVNLWSKKMFKPNEFLLFYPNIVVCCGIGRPEIFVRMLKTEGFEIKHQIFYPDHYWYKIKDLKMWKQKINYPVVMTYKDIVKILPLMEKIEPKYFEKIYYCNIKLEINEGADVWQQLINSL